MVRIVRVLDYGEGLDSSFGICLSYKLLLTTDHHYYVFIKLNF